MRVSRPTSRTRSGRSEEPSGVRPGPGLDPGGGAGRPDAAAAPAPTPGYPAAVALPPPLLTLAESLAPSAAGVRGELARYQAAAAVGGLPAYDRAVALTRALAAAEPARAWELAEALPADAPWPRALRALVRSTVQDAGAGLVDLEEAVHPLPPADPLRVPLLGALGRGYAQLGDVALAAQAFHEAAALAHQLGHPEIEGRMIASLGFLHGEHDDPIPYEEATRRALELLRPSGDARLIAHALCNLAGALARQGRTVEARAALEEGWPLARELDWQWGQALYLAGFGGVLANLGKLDESLAAYRRSLELLTDLGDEFQRTRHLLMMSRHLVAHDRHAEAVQLLTECVTSCRTHFFAATLSQALEELSHAHEAMGDAAGALAALREHVRLAQQGVAAQVADRVRLAELRFEARAQREAAHTDPLTHLPNRRFQDEELRRLEHAGPWSVALLDVDQFKAINDAHGHAVGDEVLVELARRLRGQLRISDQIARWGGEEFCLTMPGARAADAMRIAQRLTGVVAATAFATAGGALAVSISVGVAESQGGTPHATLLERADRALYAAKAAGRGRVVVAAPE